MIFQLHRLTFWTRNSTVEREDIDDSVQDVEEIDTDKDDEETGKE